VLGERCFFPLEKGILVCSGYHIASLQQSIRNVQECRSNGGGGIVVRARAPRMTRYAHGTLSNGENTL
jgi:hypothetical protein